MALLTLSPYKAKEFPLSGLHGISDHTLEIHFGLYAGYVKNTNLLTEQLVELAGKGQAATPTYHELTRRLPFEYNGMVLHEWYFGNLARDAGGEISSSSPLGRAIGESFGDIETWKRDFTAIGGMRGVGWAVTYLDTADRPAVQPVDHPAPGREHRRLQAGGGDGRLGARVPARLQAGGAAEVHRGVHEQPRRLHL